MIEVGKVKSGQFKAEFFSGALTHTLSSSAPLTITPPTGKVLRLDYLSSQNGVYDVSVTIGSVAVINSKVLGKDYGTAAGSFIVSNSVTSNGTQAFASNAVQPLISFESDQPITITQADSNSNSIYYSYSYGE